MVEELNTDKGSQKAWHLLKKFNNEKNQHNTMIHQQ